MKINKLIKNLEKKFIFGSSPELKPADAVDKLLLSYENFKVTDLLSEGPIAGMVDANGKYVNGLDILCGVYFDNTPVKETTKTSIPFYRYPINLESNGTSNIYTASELSDYIKTDVIIEIKNAIESTEKKNSTSRSKEEIIYLKYLLSSLTNIANNLDFQYSDFIEFDNNLNKKISPLLFSSKEVKFLVIDRLNLTNFLREDLGFIGKPSIKVMWESADGEIGELKGRFKKFESDSENFNYNEIVNEISEPMDFFNFLSRIKFSRGTATNINYTELGMFIIPIASGDDLALDGNNEIYFNSVDSNCIDPISQNKLNGSKLFLAVEKASEANNFNYNQINFQLLQGYEDQPPSYLSNKVTRSINISFNLKGPIDNSSFTDRVDPKFLNKNLEPDDIEALYNLESNLYLDAPSIYSALSTTESLASDGVSINDVIAKKATTDDFKLKVDLGKVRTGSYQWDYAIWVKQSIPSYTRAKREIYKHIIENESVDEVSVVFSIQQLYDQNIRGSDQMGNQLPAFLELAVIIGLEGDEDINDPIYPTLALQRNIITFTIEGLVQNGYRLKIGNGIIKSDSISNFENLKKLNLPKSINGKNRYIKVLRITPETFSSKRKIEVSVSSIEEHQNNFFSYPLTCFSRTSLDSRSYSKLPERTFDLRLKKVLVPSNYWPLETNGIDKRLIENKYSYNNDKQIYYGDWDGTFRYDWTDNPAWILYDLLTNPIYGVGNSIDALEDINIWRLYEIGRYSDAVDDNGYFIGVDDGYGGLEPRFSCNLIINEESEAFDMINSIATIFRGNVFYAGSEIDFYYDKPKDPIALFSNKNVKDGNFSYSDSLKTTRYTVVEVPYIDRRDDYIQKVEYYEDEENINRYGYIKKTFQGIGITSRSQALRFAKYSLLSNKYESEKVNFIASEEAIFIEPGDIIRIDDKLKNIDSASNYIAHIDYENKYIISPLMETGGFGDTIYLYKENGSKTIEQIFEEVYEKSLDFDIEMQNSYQRSNFLYLDIESLELTGTENGGSGIKINLNPLDEKINELNDVSIGNNFSIQLTGRDENLYKVIAKTESNNGEFEILALNSEQRKYAEIESGILFDKDQEYFKNLSIDYNSNDPDPPASVSLSTAQDGNGVYIQIDITENQTWPLTDKYECLLISPQGNIQRKEISNTSTNVNVKFYDLKEFGGDYEGRVYSIGRSPLVLKSKQYTSDSLTLELDAVALYDAFYIKDLAIDSFRSDFDASSNPAIEGSGSYYLYLDNSIYISLTLVDRLGYILSNQTQFLEHYDKPYINIDLYNSSNTLIKENLREKVRNNFIVITKYEIEKEFSDDYPRSFKLKLKVYSNSTQDIHTSTITISAPEPEFRSVSVSSAYDGISNSFILYGEASNFSKERIERIELYTGLSSIIDDTNSDNLLYRIDSADSYLKNKTARLGNYSIYKTFINDNLFSPESIKDKLFFHGEKVAFRAENDVVGYENGIEIDKEYEIILGNTIDSFFLFNSDYAYENSDPNTGLYNMSYYYTGQYSREYWNSFLQLNASDSADHQNGGTGLLYGINSDYVENDETKSLSLETIISQKGYRKDVDALYIFNNNGVRIATSGSIDCPVQRKRNSATYTAAFKISPFETEQVIFDFGSPTGGMLFYLGYQDSKMTYNIKAITHDNAGSTGEKINLTGHLFEGLDPTIDFSLFTNITINTLVLGSDPDFTGFTEARFHLNGDLINGQVVSGWGLNEHNHACGIGVMIGDSVDGASANSLSNNMGSGITGDFLEIGMYSKAFTPQDVFKDYINTRNEYFFQISTGNKNIFNITGNNTEDTLSIQSVDSEAYEIRVGQKYSFVKADKNNNLVSLYGSLYDNDMLNGVKKQIAFLKTTKSEYDIISDIINSSYYLSEKDYLSDDYIWINFDNPVYKLRYLPNVADFDDPASLFVYSSNDGNTYRITGVRAEYFNGSDYSEGCRLYALSNGAIEIDNYEANDIGYFKNLTGLNGGLPENISLEFINYSGNDKTKPIFYITTSYTPNITNDFIYQETATVEEIGVQNGNWEGYIGGVNGAYVSGSGNFKRYEGGFTDFISVTGYYPYGRWIVYSGISPSGNVGSLSWGGYDIVAHYTGEGGPVNPQGQINIEKDFSDWTNTNKILEISKNPPTPSIFSIFKTDYSLLGRNAKNINEVFSLTSQLKPSALVEYSDFYIKLKLYDFIGSSTINNTYLVNYAYTEPLADSNQINNLIGINESLLQLNQKIQNAQQEMWQDLYSVGADSYLEYLDAESIFKETQSPQENTSNKLPTAKLLFIGATFNMQNPSVDKPFQFESDEKGVTLYYRYIIIRGDEIISSQGYNNGEYLEATSEGATNNKEQYITETITLNGGDILTIEWFSIKLSHTNSNPSNRTITLQYTGNQVIPDGTPDDGESSTGGGASDPINEEDIDNDGVGQGDIVPS